MKWVLHCVLMLISVVSLISTECITFMTLWKTKLRVLNTYRSMDIFSHSFQIKKAILGFTIKWKHWTIVHFLLFLLGGFLKRQSLQDKKFSFSFLFFSFFFFSSSELKFGLVFCLDLVNGFYLKVSENLCVSFARTDSGLCACHSVV